MSLGVSGLSAYTDENKMDLIKKSVLGGRTLDFISIQPARDDLYSVIGVEVKTNGILSREEKEKCLWYIKNKVFSQIWIARSEREGRKIVVKYEDFMERYGNKMMERGK